MNGQSIQDKPGAPTLPGQVSLVGAGPGDPELLTMKAARLLREADLVLYDQLVSPAVLDLVGQHAELIYVGKKCGCHALPQEDIIKLMLRLASEGRSLVRLKGGDPYVFGRGGEEALALAEAGIPFEVVPGISAAQGMAACTGIPLTHRDVATSVVFVTGHFSGHAATEPDWASLARPDRTVVVYMGVAAMSRICGELMRHGLHADTPVAVIENATLATQRTLVATLQSMPSVAAANDVKTPALIVVGQVVALRARLAQGVLDAAASSVALKACPSAMAQAA